MDMKVNFRSLQSIVICLLLLTSIWICFQHYPSSKLISIKKAWLCFRLIIPPCLSTEECAVFNLTCYSNGTIIFHGINNTAYIGKKIFQLELNRINSIHEFIRIHSFTSDFQSKKILFRIEFFDKNNEIYFWRNDSISYTILTSLLNIHTLASYKRWSVLLRTAYMLSNRQQKFKRSVKNPSIQSKSLIIPITRSPYITNDYNQYITSTVQSIKTIEIVLIPKLDDDFCFSSQVTTSTFDLIDACLSTNDIIGVNQFYPLRDQFIWSLNENELIDMQGKFLRVWLLFRRDLLFNIIIKYISKIR
jgi:hypothetical protein